MTNSELLAHIAAIQQSCPPDVHRGHNYDWEKVLAKLSVEARALYGSLQLPDELLANSANDIKNYARRCGIQMEETVMKTPKIQVSELKKIIKQQLTTILQEEVETRSISGMVNVGEEDYEYTADVGVDVSKSLDYHGDRFQHPEEVSEADVVSVEVTNIEPEPELSIEKMVIAAIKADIENKSPWDMMNERLDSSSSLKETDDHNISVIDADGPSWDKNSGSNWYTMACLRYILAPIDNDIADKQQKIKDLIRILTDKSKVLSKLGRKNQHLTK